MRKKRKKKQKNNILFIYLAFILILGYMSLKETDMFISILTSKSVLIIISLVMSYFLLKFAIKRLLKKMKQNRYLRSNLGKVDKMTGTEFEEYLAAHFDNLGYKVEHIGQSGDYGADLILSRDGISVAVQAKRYQDKVGVKAVQEVISAKEYYECDSAMVVTNSYFTPNAIQMATQCNVELWDRENIRKRFPNI